MITIMEWHTRRKNEVNIHTAFLGIEVTCSKLRGCHFGYTVNALHVSEVELTYPTGGRYESAARKR